MQNSGGLSGEAGHQQDKCFLTFCVSTRLLVANLKWTPDTTSAASFISFQQTDKLSLQITESISSFMGTVADSQRNRCLQHRFNGENGAQKSLGREIRMRTRVAGWGAARGHFFAALGRVAPTMALASSQQLPSHAGSSHRRLFPPQIANPQNSSPPGLRNRTAKESRSWRSKKVRLHGSIFPPLLRITANRDCKHFFA